MISVIVGLTAAEYKMDWILVLGRDFILVSKLHFLPWATTISGYCLIHFYVHNKLDKRPSPFSLSLSLWFLCFLFLVSFLIVMFILQTHTKLSKKSQQSHASSIIPDESILAAIEPPPYGTSNAVCTIICSNAFP